MDSVKVGPDSLLPGSRGLSSPFSCLNNARCVTLVIFEKTGILRSDYAGTASRGESLGL